MKKALVILIALVFSTQLFAQKGPKEDRNSPPAKVSAVAAKSIITIDYSQPYVKGRKVWGGIVPLDSVWRTGANEATTFETSREIRVNGNVLPAGKYSLFTIPSADEWTVIFNKQAEQWGSKSYDVKQDQLRFKVKPGKTKSLQEQLVFYIENNLVLLKWENTELVLNITK